MVSKFCQNFSIILSKPSNPTFNSVRYARGRHRIARFAIMNTYQPWPNSPNVKEIMGNFDVKNPATMRDEMRRMGLLPQRNFNDRKINMSSTDSIFDPYNPPEADGTSSFFSIAKSKLSTDSTTGVAKNLNSTRKIKKYEADFKQRTFVDRAEPIYCEVLNLLPKYKENDHRLLQLVTEKALADMIRGIEMKTLEHRFIRHIDSPKLVAVRTMQGLTDGDLFAQCTVRFFSEQVISIYDKFGRLVYGDPSNAMEVLEYVIFEKLVSEDVSSWRIHAKIVPNWANQKLVPRRVRVVVANEDNDDSPSLVSDQDNEPQTSAATSSPS